MTTSVDFNSILFLIDRGIKPYYLNSTQEIVLKEVWNGQTYSKIAQDHNYDPEYIKTVGCNLWKTLSSAFNEPINKSNFVPLMRQKFNNFISTEAKDRALEQDSQPKIIECWGKPHCYWATAPNVKNFVGRQKEIELLNSWSQTLSCNCIVVAGMVGCGKTSLITKFAKDSKNKFDRVIWLSLEKPLSVKVLIDNYLKIVDDDYDDSLEPKIDRLDLNLLLSRFINCLRKQRILLVLDNLEAILEIDNRSLCYKEQLENYGHFLRSVVSTNHQSLLVCASRVKPKLLEYYGINQVKLLDLQGLENSQIDKFIAAENPSVGNNGKLLDLSHSLQNNPQLLQIADEHLHLFEEGINNIQQIVEELSLLETTIDLLEQELSCLSKLEKEIVFWIAISCFPVSQKYLATQSTQGYSKIKFANSIKSLQKRSLIIKDGTKCTLMPIMKSYLRRKLVAQAL